MSHTGETRNIIDEKTRDVHLDRPHGEPEPRVTVNWLEKTDEIIYVSERDGWRHLYLIDAKAGKSRTQITKGEWVVRGIDRIDEDEPASLVPRQRQEPGSGSVLHSLLPRQLRRHRPASLTEGNGNHSVQFSPDRKFFIDTYSRVDLPPVHELRRVSDGKLVCKLEEADVTELKASGWTAPEVFVAKGRDGKTDIWGIICRPRNFDPNKKYPVIEDIYAGPQGSFVPKTFSAALAIRVAHRTRLHRRARCDGMGTATARRRFTMSAGRTSRTPASRTASCGSRPSAAKYPYMDITRVGIYGTSAGGQNAAGAVLFHPDFYKVAVASAAATTTAWTRLRGTSSGWAIRSARTTPSARTSTTPTGCEANCC